MYEEKQIVYRCPVCFARENDVVLRKEGEEYYCIKCSFTGTEEDIRSMYADLKKKYRFLERRITFEELQQM